jgi:5-methylcytosine-specific restriction endonuclease McrA
MAYLEGRMTARVSAEEIVEAYKATGSVWKASKQLGIAGQSVHERLRALGYPIAGRRWSAEEVDELRALVEAGVTAGQIASRLGRSFAGVTCKLSELSLISPRPSLNKPKRATGYDRKSIDVHLRALEGNPRMRPTSYCRAVGLDIESFVQACQRHFADRWDGYSASISTIPTKECGYCRRIFYPTNGKQQTCSRKCARDARQDRDYFGGQRRNTIGLAAGICQLCGREGHKGLSSHHVLGKENDPDNEVLIALCPGCHKIITMLATRKFVDDTAAWESVIALTWLRRHGGDLEEGKALYVSVVIDNETFDREDL